MSSKRTNGPNARGAALKILCRLQNEKGSLTPLMEEHFAHLSPVDRGLGSKLIMGILRNMGRLDSILASYSKHPLAKMKNTTLMALRLGVYQLVFLDRIPPAAAVNETVKALKNQRQPQWLVNFVNGVLRKISSNIEELRKNIAKGEDYPYSHPTWMVDRWTRYFGEQECRKICSANNREQPLCLRVNTGRTSRDRLRQMFHDARIDTEAGRYAPDALVVLTNIGSPTLLPGYGEGLFQVQGEAAQLASLLPGPFRDDKKYLDACAGLGGKTCHLAQLVGETGRLWAVEPDKHRFSLLGENLSRMVGEQRVETINLPLEEFALATTLTFDSILLDVPCSGTGVIGKHPEIRYNRTEPELKGYHETQLKLLRCASTLLTKGGILVYATCSLEPEENEEVIAEFLAETPGFAMTPCSDFLPSGAKDLVDSTGFFRSNQAMGLEGFFAARLQKIS